MVIASWIGNNLEGTDLGLIESPSLNFYAGTK
jgi:hypothetical protein